MRARTRVLVNANLIQKLPNAPELTLPRRTIRNFLILPGHGALYRDTARRGSIGIETGARARGNNLSPRLPISSRGEL